MPIQRIANTDIQTATTFTFSNTLFGLGSAGTPSLAFSGDTNTGIFSPGADTIAFAEGGTEVMRIDSSGNIGVGTSSPAQKLDVNGVILSSAGDFRAKRDGSDTAVGGAAYILQNNASTRFWATQLGASNSYDWWYFDGSAWAQYMRIDSLGEVGISCTPTSMLDISSGYRNGNNSALNIGANDSSNARTNNARKIGLITFPHYSTSNEKVFLMAGDADSSVNSIFIGGGYTGYTAATQLLFYTGATSTTTIGTERMRIDSSGNVGIGRVPSSRLDLEAASGQTKIILRNVGNTVDSSTYIAAETGSVGDWANLTLAARHALRFVNNSVENMRISSAGNVGIGTNNPGQKLQVAGNTVLDAGGGNTYLNVISGSSSIQIATDGSTQFIYGVGNFPLTFSTNGAERMRIDSSGRVTMSSQPAFCVGKSGTISATGVIVFDVTSGSGGAAVFFNRGSHYNSSNGRFTAPVAGAYQFNFMALLTGPNGAWVEVDTLRNGTISHQVRRETIGADNTTVNLHTVIYMNANDYLQISINGFQASANFQANDSRIFTSFSGVLLS
jgi:hypothetical protein